MRALLGDHNRQSSGRAGRVGDETAPNSSMTASDAQAGGAPERRENDRSAVAADHVTMYAPWHGPIRADVSHSDGRRGGGERAGQASRASRAANGAPSLTARAVRDICARSRVPVSDS
jgi:hypothetical protein